MNVTRIFPSDEASAIVELASEIAVKELSPRVEDFEQRGEFPREVLRVLGRSGLLSLPYPQRFGGAEASYEVYVQVLEELAYRWVAVAEAISVHTLACYGLASFGSPQQQEESLPRMLSGETLGAYCLTEPSGGSDAASLTTKAAPRADDFVINGTKAFITHAGIADFYTVFARTGGPGAKGISCFLVEADTPGLAAQRPENKMGLNSSPTGEVVFDDVAVPRKRLLGEQGAGFSIAMSALNSGRLGIAACAVGLAQAALDHATDYAKQRRQFGQAIVDFQGVGFMLADMATQVNAARALLCHAARLRDAGRDFAMESAQAKLFATDVAVRVTTDAVQVLGGYGYVSDYPLERFFREAKVLQIVEGTNQIQRLVIARRLAQS